MGLLKKGGRCVKRSKHEAQKGNFLPCLSVAKDKGTGAKRAPVPRRRGGRTLMEGLKTLWKRVRILWKRDEIPVEKRSDPYGKR